MKTIGYFFCVTVALSFGCSGKKSESESEQSGSSPSGSVAAKPAPVSKSMKGEIGTWKSVPNSGGLVADVPPQSVPNGVGGAAGFHSKDNSFGFSLVKVSSARTGMSLAEIKKEHEEMFFKKWIKADPIDGGWLLHWQSPKMDFSGDAAKEIGVQHSFEIRRNIGGTLYKCYGAVSEQGAAEVTVKTCMTVKPG